VGGPPTADLLAVAEEAARAAATLLVPRFGSERASDTKSSPTDLVSEADLVAEGAIREVLAARRPDDGILGEEGTGDVAGTSGLRWIVDPIDGTIDFLYGHPQWSVSVAVRDAAGTLAGIVLDPLREERWAATRDGEATLNGAGVRASTCATLASALVATGFGYEAGVRREQAEALRALLPEVRDIRRMGSAALDLAWAAAGRHDAYFERGVKPWDVAAGALLCERAGLAVRELAARNGLPSGIAVAPPALIEALLSFVG